ncbi:MAG: UDP-3-O-(3-hydroxymyristoyl)glucosamine N-acyltransferase [Rhodospirillales bacterium]|nr:UDP-3-O-(3-hydroxymyristoyl)glucosamine N-acyltransferase [Rhodospirillales bacterium]
MADPRFYSVAGPIKLHELAKIAGADIAKGGDPDSEFVDVRALSDAGSEHVSFLDNKRYVESFSKSQAGVCLVHPDHASSAPKGMALLLTKEPYRAYARVAQAFYPKAAARKKISDSAIIHKTAKIGKSCRIDAGAVIGAKAEIGPNCHIGANAVIGDGVVLGQDCIVGPCVSLSHAIVGDRVIIHSGVQIGQDGFGFAPGADEHLKVPQLGRVLIDDDVDIGANTTIDRGSGPDTVIGAGTKIDNLVHIGHNVKIGKKCLIVGQTGVSGSTVVEDFVIMGGKAGIAGHLKIGKGTRIAAKAGVVGDLEPGSTVGGFPARPMKEWLRGVAVLRQLAKKAEEK